MVHSTGVERWVWLLVGLAACGEFTPGPDPLDASGPDASVGDAAPLDAGTSSLNVIFSDESGPTSDYCGPEACFEPYLEFTAQHPDNARPADLSDINRAVDEEFAADQRGDIPKPLDLSASELREVVVDVLNIGFLLDGLDERPLVVRRGETENDDGFRREVYYLVDPHVGTMRVLTLVPDAAEPPFRAILALHGHDSGPERFTNFFGARQLAEQGFFIALPELRGAGCDAPEGRISEALLVGGYTHMGLRVYESLLTFKLMRFLEQVDNGRVGVLSHSGGSSTANLLTRIEQRFAGQVTDLQSHYTGRCLGVFLHCESVPGMLPYSSTVFQLDTLPFPAIVVPYGFEDPVERRRVLDFFPEHL